MHIVPLVVPPLPGPGECGSTGLDVPGLVRRVRRNAGMSQRAFATVLGCSKSTVAKWESGRSHPRLVRLEQILAISQLQLKAVNASGSEISGFGRDAALDRAGRQYPAHINLLRWRPGRHWWGLIGYGVHCMPPEFVWGEPGWVAILGGVELDRPDDERTPRETFRQRRASFGSFRAAWRAQPGYYPPKGYSRSDAVRFGFHPDVVGVSQAFLAHLDDDGRVPPGADDARFPQRE